MSAWGTERLSHAINRLECLSCGRVYQAWAPKELWLSEFRCHKCRDHGQTILFTALCKPRYFIDFMSLDQPGTHVLPHIHVLYAHEMTFTYQIPSLTPETKFQEALALEETAVKALKPPKTLLKHLVLNDRPYSQRGWCQAEVQWSLLRSNLLRLVRLGPQTDEVGCSPMAPRYFQALLLKKEMAFTDPRDQAGVKSVHCAGVLTGPSCSTAREDVCYQGIKD